MRRDLKLAKCPLFEILPSPQEKSEELLVHGFMRMHYVWIPEDLKKAICSFFPQLYGGRYRVKQHNPSLMNELEQKTKPFRGNDIDMTLQYGSSRSNMAMGGFRAIDYDNLRYFMTMDFSKSKAVVVVLCVSVRCTISDRSDTRIFTVTVSDFDDRIGRNPLPDFGWRTSLSSLVCDVQILNMLAEDDGLYECPVLLRQSAYLLEWTLSREMVDRFREYVQKQESGVSFESRVFHEMYVHF